MFCSKTFSRIREASAAATMTFAQLLAKKSFNFFHFSTSTLFI
jgi:hypothetical protein